MTYSLSEFLDDVPDPSITWVASQKIDTFAFIK